MSMNIGELFLTLSLKGGEAFSSALQSARGHMIAFGSAATVAGAAAIKLASDFNETTNVIQQSFGKGAAAAEQWAAATAAAMGRSTQQMRETVGVMQSMLTPMLGNADAADTMSKALTRLAVDMGSFWNAADTDAFAALRSAISGETEPMKRFGVVMTEAALNAYALAQGINVTMQHMTEAEKTQVRFHYLMEQTAIVQGDAERTADSLANQMKALKADMENAATAMGQSLLPEAQEWVRITRETLEVFKGTAGTEFLSNISAAMKTFVDAILMAVEGWLLLAKVMVENNPFGDGKAPTVDNSLAVVSRLRGVLQGGSGKDHDFSWDSSGGKMDARADSGPSWDTGWADDNKKGWTAGIRGKAATAKEPKSYEIGGAWNEAKDVIEFMKGFGHRMRNSLHSEGALFAGSLGLASKGLVSLNGVSEKTAKEMTDRERKASEEYAKAQARRHAAAEVGLAGAYRSVMGFMGGNGDLESMFRGVVGGVEKAAPAFGLPSSVGPVFGMFTDAIVNGAKEFASIVTGAAKAMGEFIVPFLPTDKRFGGALSKGMSVGGGVGMAAASMTAASPAGLAIMGPMAIPAMALAPLIAGAAAAGGMLLELSKETQSYARFQKALSRGVDEVVKALEPMWNNLMPVAGIFIMTGKVVGMFAGSLMPGARAADALGKVVLEVAQGLSTLNLAAYQIWLAFAEGKLHMYEFFEALAPGDQFSRQREVAQRNIDEAEGKVSQANDLRDKLARMTLSELAALAGEVDTTTSGFRALNATLTNMPSGFKGLAGMALAAMDATGDPLAGGGDGMSATGLRNRHMDGTGREAGFGGQVGVQVNGNITVVANDPDQFRAKLERKAFVQTGTPLPGVHAFLAGS